MHDLSRRTLLAGFGSGAVLVATKSFADDPQPTEADAKIAKESGSLRIEIDLDADNLRLVQSTGAVVGFFQPFPDPLPNRRQLDLRINGLNVKLVNAFFTEARNGKPHFGAAEFLTRGCMYNGKTIRVIGYLDDTRSYRGGLMILAQT